MYVISQFPVIRAKNQQRRFFHIHIFSQKRLIKVKVRNLWL